MAKYYRFLHSDIKVRKGSSSGGAFTMISDVILLKNGVVYGCIMDESLHVKHARATSFEERDPMRKSKYVQSDMRAVWSSIVSDLQNHRLVLFSGTPCQVKGLISFLEIKKIDRENLLLVEVVCHGVGSSMFFDDYIHHLESKYKGKATSVDFRAHKYKGQKQNMDISFSNGSNYYASSTKYDWFFSAYLRNYILRPSCYVCPFAKVERYADITIADHWGYNSEESYSLIVCNSMKGEKYLNESKEEITLIEESEVRQAHMLHPCKKPEKREHFWRIYETEGYLEAQRFLGNNTVKGKTKDCLVRMAYKLHIAGLIKKIQHAKER